MHPKTRVCCDVVLAPSSTVGRCHRVLPVVCRRFVRVTVVGFCGPAQTNYSTPGLRIFTDDLIFFFFFVSLFLSFGLRTEIISRETIDITESWCLLS